MHRSQYLRDPLDVSIIQNEPYLQTGTDNAPPVAAAEVVTNERLSRLAMRNNTYIDNPYQSSHIKHGWTRDSLAIQALENHSSLVKKSSYGKMAAHG